MQFTDAIYINGRDWKLKLLTKILHEGVKSSVIILARLLLRTPRVYTMLQNFENISKKTFFRLYNARKDF